MALLLTWLAPLANCDGSALDLDHYNVWTEVVVQVGSWTDAQGVTWPLYTKTFDLRQTVYTSMDLGEPKVGGGVFWKNPVAVDAAGNTSDDCP